MPLTPEQAEALIPDELLQRIQNFAFGGRRRRASSHRRAGSRAPFTFGGKTTQYPQVDARSDG